MATHFHSDVMRYYLEQTKAVDATAGNVKHFWQNNLPSYFRTDDLYGIEFGPNPSEDFMNICDNLTVCSFRGGSRKTVFQMDISKPMDEVQPRRWEDAAERLIAYLKAVREREFSGTTFGAIAIGCHVRFYMLGPDEMTLHNVGRCDPYELEADESEIDSVMQELVELISQGK